MSESTTHNLPMFDQSTDAGRAGLRQRVQQLRETAVLTSEQAQKTASLIEDVASRGDAAVVEAMQRFTDARFSRDRIRVTSAEIEAAANDVQRHQPRLIEALQRAIDHIRQYQHHILPQAPPAMTLDGAELGLRYRPVQSAGLCVPGGSAVLFSTLLMLAVPAQVAGVPREKISVIHPPPTRTNEHEQAHDISPIVLAACHLLGIERVYRIGGAQGVAALAYGTETVEPVDLVAGPGNVFVQLAKAQVAGTIGTDNGFYGPSEIVSLVDDKADARRVASDLIAQAEHDPGKCFLVTWQRSVLDAVVAEVDRQVAQHGRAEAIVKALQHESAAILAAGEQAAVEVVNDLAADRPHGLNLEVVAVPGVSNSAL